MDFASIWLILKAKKPLYGTMVLTTVRILEPVTNWEPRDRSGPVRTVVKFYTHSCVKLQHVRLLSLLHFLGKIGIPVIPAQFSIIGRVAGQDMKVDPTQVSHQMKLPLVPHKRLSKSCWTTLYCSAFRSKRSHSHCISRVCTRRS